MQCEVWSVECEDFASSLAEKIKRLSREGHGRDRVSLNYRSFMFGKLPPPACPGLCYKHFFPRVNLLSFDKVGKHWVTTGSVFHLDLGVRTLGVGNSDAMMLVSLRIYELC